MAIQMRCLLVLCIDLLLVFQSKLWHNYLPKKEMICNFSYRS
ncbi:MAG: hypothetical protein J1E62_11545 [Lachnospiraceae bacterium]|nr:hypothetical protein [Lachnospiraceae bacterium]